MKLLFFLLSSIQVGQLVFAQPVFSPDSVLTAKSFPLLSLFQHDLRYKQAVQQDKELKRQSLARYKRVSQSLDQCQSTPCLVNLLKWTDPEIGMIGDGLVRLYQEKNYFREIVSQLRMQNRYALYESDADTVLLRRAWQDAAKSINRIFDIYIGAQAPR